MRNEDYTMTLFIAVGVITATLAAAVSLFDTTPSVAASKPPTYLASQESVRVIVPFVPNTNPRER
jgi:hypothetical protein